MTELVISLKGQATSAISHKKVVFWKGQLPNNRTHQQGGKKISFSNQNPQEVNLTITMQGLHKRKILMSL